MAGAGGTLGSAAGGAGADLAGSSGAPEQAVAGQSGAIETGGASEEAAGSGQIAGAGGEGAVDEPPLGAHCVGCTAIPLGAPMWKPVGAVMLAGPLGSSDTNTQPFTDFLTPILAPNHKYNPDEGVWGPGDAHPGPYLDEGFAALSAASISMKQSFSTADFTKPSGVFLTLNLVPTDSAPLGSSPDFASGPIIPNALFPVQVDGDLYRGGTLYDGYFEGDVAGFDAWQPPLLVDGSSHNMLWLAENSSWGLDRTAQGSYEFKISIMDGSGSGWEVTVPFTVSDTPTP